MSGSQLAGADVGIVVLDLTEVTFIDGRGLHALIEAAREDGGRLRIVPSPRLPPPVRNRGVRDQLPLVQEPFRNDRPPS